MMATRGTERMRAAQVVPKFGLRFDRGRTELVLDAALTLENGVRLDAMRTELVPLAGRLSLTEGWRAFRHRRSTLVSATLSIGLRELGSMIERAIGLPLRLLALAPNVVSCATTTPALCIATELEWGWDGEDLLLVLTGARSVPQSPRPALALVHDLALGAGASFDRERGVLRVERPLRRALIDALAFAGIRVPDASAVPCRARVEGDRLVIEAERATGPMVEASRASIERARAAAARIAACLDEGEPAPDDGSDVARAALHLAALLAVDGLIGDGAPAVVEAAEDYARRERHPALASSALLFAAERARGVTASRLALAAIERGGLTRSTDLARAIEIAAAHTDARTLPWEQLSRSLEGAGALLARARGLALERAGRVAQALEAFGEATRAQPTDGLAQRGLARSLDVLERFDEAIDAWDRAATLSEGEDALAARCAAARAADLAGHPDAAIARLRALVASTSEGGLHPLLALRDLSRLLHARQGLAHAIEVDRALPQLADTSGAMFAADAAGCLRPAIARALEGGETALARALASALERALGEAGDTEIARLEVKIAQGERSALATTSPLALRARADALRAAGDHAEAARLLVEVFVHTKDAAVLRAAIELADRATDRDGRRAVLDRALEVLPEGPAREAIAARRRE